MRGRPWRPAADDVLIRRTLRALLGGSARAHGAVHDQPSSTDRGTGTGVLPYRGYFINLDRSDGRRRSFEAQLERLGLAGCYERFPAVDGRSLDPGTHPHRVKLGEAGCFLSHLRALEAARRAGTDVHVVEDDVILARSLATRLATIVDEGLLSRYDLVYTDTLVPFQPDLLRQYLRICAHASGTPDGIQLVNLRGNFKACHASYLVGRGSLDKVIGALSEQVDAGIGLPIDILLRNLVNDGMLTAACTLPFLTAVRLDDAISTTIHGQYEAAVSVLLHNLLRNQFFIDRDDTEFERYFAEYVGPFALDGATRNIARLSAFFLSGRHRDF